MRISVMLQIYILFHTMQITGHIFNETNWIVFIGTVDYIGGVILSMNLIKIIISLKTELRSIGPVRFYKQNHTFYDDSFKRLYI